LAIEPPRIARAVPVKRGKYPLDSIPMVEQLNPTGDAADSSSDAAAAKNISLAGLRVLVVEDGVDNQRLVRWVVTKAGAELVVEENGKLGSAAALAAGDQGEPFDVVMMDMQMPVMDGYEATRLLRESDYRGAVIALTANAMAEDRQKCLDAGCDGFDTKPFKRDELVHAIFKFAQSRSADVN